MSTERTLESFDKKDLVQLIQRRFFRLDRSLLELESIERDRKGEVLMAKMEALELEMRGSLSSSPTPDFQRYKDLSKKWDQASKAYAKLYEMGRV